MTLALALGLAAGMASGVLGVGGGVLFVPALAVVLGLGLVEAEATSLLAIVPTAVVGAMRQRHYGNVRVGEGLLVGALSPLGVLAGVELAHALPELVLTLLFDAVLLVAAYRLARRALRRTPG
ncbi:MAG: TSUP family transporter [Thermoleophilaceae bacterium]